MSVLSRSTMISRAVRGAALLLALLAGTCHARAYSLLTHEEIVDLTWQDSIVPFLRSRYPDITPAQLDRARSYAYGGCAIQDVGYYPFGNQFFSDLTHYVRTGDFVLALFRNASNANELAFAAGALSHYIGDSYGHSEATNRAVAFEFPKLAARYGQSVNYAEGKHQHIQVEFAFDVDQIVQHHLAPLAYLRHIGLSVPVRQLALAYYQTYGVTDNFSTAEQLINIRSYRLATRKFIPRVAFGLVEIHRTHEPDEPDTPEAKEIEREAAAVAVANQWPSYRKSAGFETHLVAFLIRIVPKIGPLSLVAIKGPTPAAEVDYMHSLVSTTSVMRNRLRLFTPIANRIAPPAGATIFSGADLSEDRQHPLLNRDLDTGQPVRPGGYRLTDTTYAALLKRLTRRPAQPIPPGIKQNVLAYYSDPNAPIVTKKDPGKWATVQSELKTLAAMPTSNEPEPVPTYDSMPDAESPQTPAN